MMPDLEHLLPEIVALADRAGAVILEHYQGDVVVRAKADASPVTAADEAAEAVILARLAELTPAIPTVAEETVASGHVPEIDDGPFWLVDPLDGTKEFLSRNGEFTVNIALIQACEPVLCVVLAPARGQAWWGAHGKGARARDAEGRTRAIAVREPPDDGLVAIASRSHRDAETQAFLDRAGVAECISAGSSLKFCLIAEGKADLYPRFGRTMEWDTAAGHAVLSAAGGRVTTRDGAPFLYRKRGFENPPFIARGA
jgi:3'(2'), 5'-bisphosphate nucleotidase